MRAMQEYVKNELPSNAKRVFEGIRFDVYQWEQELFDGKTTTFEIGIRLPTVQLIVLTENNKLILLQEEQPFNGKYIGMCGGGVERDEMPLDSVKKELLEETGRKVNDEDIEFWRLEEFGSKTYIWHSYYYILRNTHNGFSQKLEGGEKIKVLELDFDEFVDLTQSKDFRNKFFQSEVKKMIEENKLEEFRELIFNKN